MGSAEWPKLFGHGESEQEMPAGQSPLNLCIEPLAAFMVLALGAMSISAGSVDGMIFAAAVAPVDGDAICAGPAVDDGMDGLFMLAGHMGILSDVLLTESAEDLGNGAHDPTSAMTALMIW
jgi:hypothetical protein